MHGWALGVWSVEFGVWSLETIREMRTGQRQGKGDVDLDMGCKEMGFR